MTSFDQDGQIIPELKLLMKRRHFLGFAGACFTHVLTQKAILAQAVPSQPGNLQQNGVRLSFRYNDVIKRARDLAAQEYNAKPPSVPDALANLDFDAYRDIKFKEDKTLLTNAGGPFRMQLYPLGFLFRRPVTINIVRDGLPTPVPYTASLFDYGKTKLDKPLPVDTGFAGFRLYYPLVDQKSHDETVSFIGASYFRFMSRGQTYGLSARGLALNAGLDGQPEEFPYFQEFWVEQPQPGVEKIEIHALLDSPSLSGAYQFVFHLGQKSVVEITATLFPRKELVRPGIAPLTSMFFYGENDRRLHGDYRPELHDSDGLLLQGGNGEFLWRPLRNPTKAQLSAFVGSNIKGFGLMQRDAEFEHYQDLDLKYEKRPSYWIEPLDGWGDGQVELVELPTTDETNDNIVAYWMPKAKMEAGQTYTFRYRVSSLPDAVSVNPGGYVVNTFQAPAKALGSTEAVPPGATRFLIDFAGGELAYHQAFPDFVQVVASVSNGTILRSYVLKNPEISGFRAAVDVAVPPGQTGDVRAFLKNGNKTLTETWTMPWKPEA